MALEQRVDKLEARMDRVDRRLEATSKLIEAGMKMLAKTQVETRALVDAQMRHEASANAQMQELREAQRALVDAQVQTEDKLNRLISALGKNGSNGHKK